MGVGVFASYEVFILMVWKGQKRLYLSGYILVELTNPNPLPEQVLLSVFLRKSDGR